MYLIIVGFIFIITLILSDYIRGNMKCRREIRHKPSISSVIKISLEEGFSAVYFWCGMYLIAILVIVGFSYSNYVNARTFYDATVEQYRSAITVYQDNAVLDVKEAFTDLKYEGYQQSLTTLIVDLRKEIVGYNKTVVGKRIMDKNPLFSLLIIAPDDDMKVIRLKER